MNLIAVLYTLTLLTSSGAAELGTSETDLTCAAAIGYISANVEKQGGQPTSDLTRLDDGTFSWNFVVPGEDGEPVHGSLICTPEVV